MSSDGAGGSPRSACGLALNGEPWSANGLPPANDATPKSAINV
ncbi:MAG: hypothetical protein NAOJABEB_03080 [Steroidobacteraceae bacterium]|nr:hypothetical protein [Steroidobacteraceae bacterium]